LKNGEPTESPSSDVIEVNEKGKVKHYRPKKYGGGKSRQWNYRQKRTFVEAILCCSPQFPWRAPERRSSKNYKAKTKQEFWREVANSLSKTSPFQKHELNNISEQRMCTKLSRWWESIVSERGESYAEASATENATSEDAS